MKVITESEMDFGKFDDAALFHIEDSALYKDLGDGIKTVEFILKRDDNNIIFLEAKSSCPNAKNRTESEEKEMKFEEYYSSITEKFIESLQIYLAAILGKYENISDVGTELQLITTLKDMQLKFVLVIKNAKDVAWLMGPSEELRERLRPFCKIWDAEVVVLNEELAGEYGLTC